MVQEEEVPAYRATLSQTIPSSTILTTTYSMTLEATQGVDLVDQIHDCLMKISLTISAVAEASEMSPRFFARRCHDGVHCTPQPLIDPFTCSVNRRHLKMPNRIDHLINKERMVPITQCHNNIQTSTTSASPLQDQTMGVME